jgi:hypothetical protein
MSVSTLINKLQSTPNDVSFEEVIACITEYYNYTATRFTNGDVVNDAGSNEGSCKIFAFAQINQLNEQATLSCFGRYYQEDVLANPEGNDHGNIRNFMQSGWAGIQFDGQALTLK